eukprot:Rhum_TRINITY_DN9055_c1_g1::Rhum_TRINITY_DN9055_c1_g1_i1::g.31352::m.31352
MTHKLLRIEILVRPMRHLKGAVLRVRAQVTLPHAPRGSDGVGHQRQGGVVDAQRDDVRPVGGEPLDSFCQRNVAEAANLEGLVAGQLPPHGGHHGGVLLDGARQAEEDRQVGLARRLHRTLPVLAVPHHLHNDEIDACRGEQLAVRRVVLDLRHRVRPLASVEAAALLLLRRVARHRPRHQRLPPALGVRQKVLLTGLDSQADGGLRGGGGDAPHAGPLHHVAVGGVGVARDDVGARHQVGVVHLLHDVGVGEVRAAAPPVLVHALPPRQTLDLRPRGPVEDDRAASLQDLGLQRAPAVPRVCRLQLLRQLPPALLLLLALLGRAGDVHAGEALHRAEESKRHCVCPSRPTTSMKYRYCS